MQDDIDSYQYDIPIPLWSLDLVDGIYYNNNIMYHIIEGEPESCTDSFRCIRRNFTVAGGGHDTIIILLSQYDTRTYNPTAGKCPRSYVLEIFRTIVVFDSVRTSSCRTKIYVLRSSVDYYHLWRGRHAGYRGTILLCCRA